MNKKIIAAALVVFFQLFSFASADAAVKKKIVKPSVKAKVVAKAKAPVKVAAKLESYTEAEVLDNVVQFARWPIVTITTDKKQGSGFFGVKYGDWANTSIITNSHVIENAKYIKVHTFDDETYFATVLYDDPISDVAKLTIDDGDKYLPKTTITSDQVNIGDKVVTAGSPYGLEGTYTTGEVTAIRFVNGVKCIQHTAKTWNGNSGGPLLNMKGQVIGINTMTMVDNPDIGFSVVTDYLEGTPRKPVFTGE